jgi:hypothetical protein
MARLVLTNVQEKHDSIIQRSIEAGLNDYVAHKTNGVFLSAHKKRIMKTKNFLDFDNDDFVSIVGTCIYKGLFEQPALEKIYEDFNGDIEVLRSNAIGNYLIAIKKNKKITVFVDKYQVLKTYYFNVDGEWVIANSLADVASVLNNKQLDEFQLIEETHYGGTITHDTFFKNIFQLFGNEYIEIDLSSKRFTVNTIPYSRKRWNLADIPIEDVVNQYVEIVKNVFAQVAKVFGDDIRLQMTGGRDTRTVFAGLMNAGVKPKTMYGVGNSIITNTKNGDLLANEAFRDVFDLDLHIMNWQGDDIRNMENWDKFFIRYGFYYSISGANENVFAEYEGKIPNYPRLILTGDFGENLKLRQWIQDKNTKHFSIDEFLDGYYLGVMKLSDKYYLKSKEFREYVKEKFLQASNFYGIPNENGVFHVDHFDELRQIVDRNADSFFINFLNEFTHAIAIFSIRELYECPFDVPAKYRANGKFQLMLINKLYPDAFKVPFFSHCEKHIFDENAFTLKRKKRKSERIGYILNKLGIGEYNSVRVLLRILYRSFNKGYYKGVKEEASSRKLKARLIEHINNLQGTNKFINPKHFEGNTIVLMCYAQYLNGINMLLKRALLSQ